VNNDNQAKLKTGKDNVFQDENFRLKIVSSLKVVDNVMLSVDQDGSVCESIKEITKKIKEKY
jgi:glycerol-3-phosphate cytidylyltransferase-like family protein